MMVRSAWTAAAVVLVVCLMTPATAQTSRSTDRGTRTPIGTDRPQHPLAFDRGLYPYFAVPFARRDDRTARQRCWDSEIAGLNGPVTALDERAIDLKCSQR